MTSAHRVLGRLVLGSLLAAALACADQSLPLEPCRGPGPGRAPERDPGPVPPDDPGPEPSSGAPAIFLADADGGHPTLLFAGERPAWSPDGRRIAFQRDGRILVREGTAEHDLAAGTEPSWAPDGRRIAFRSVDGIAVMADDGSGASTVIRNDFRDDTNAEWDNPHPTPPWSPDGAWIAFEHLGDGDITPATIFLMRPDGSEAHRLTTEVGISYAESDPSWSSDGSEVLLWSYGYGIARVSAAGGTPASIFQGFPAVAYGARPVQAPASGPTAGIVLFTANRYSDLPEIWAVKSTGGAASSITGGRDAVWSPDGSQILFVKLAEAAAASR
jgi:Tol biopolymer transport system component